MKVINPSSMHEVPKMQLELTEDELYKVVMALDGVAAILDTSRLHAHQHRADQYRYLSQKLDDAHMELVCAGKIQVQPPTPPTVTDIDDFPF